MQTLFVRLKIRNWVAFSINRDKDIYSRTTAVKRNLQKDYTAQKLILLSFREPEKKNSRWISRDKRRHEIRVILNTGQGRCLSHTLVAQWSHSSVSSSCQHQITMPVMTLRFSAFGHWDVKTVYCLDSELHVWAGSIILDSESLSAR